MSLSFPLPRRTAPFLLPRIALYPQSAWWRGCGGLLDGGCGAAAAAARRGGVCDWATKSKQSMSITSMQTYLHYIKLNTKACMRAAQAEYEDLSALELLRVPER